jgi:hypothetical protein
VKYSIGIIIKMQFIFFDAGVQINRDHFPDQFYRCWLAVRSIRLRSDLLDDCSANFQMLR